jgi:hypothetical protein
VAKLRFDDNVVRSDIDAAIALMRASQASIEPELQKRTREDPVSRLYMVRPLIVMKCLLLKIFRYRCGVCECGQLQSSCRSALAKTPSAGCTW